MKEMIFYVLGEVNYLAVLIAALANFFFGALWYSPILFGNVWSKLNFGDVDMEEVKKKVNMGYTMGMAFVTTFITAFALSVPIVILEVMHFELPLILLFTLFITAGFMVVNMYKHALFELKSFKLILINGSHDIIVMILMTIIIVMMQDPDVDELKELIEKMIRG